MIRAEPRFAELAAATNFSFLRGASHPEELVAQAARLGLAGIGIAASVPGALAASKLVESFLFGMRPNDPWALAAAVATLLVAALVAGYLPARKASSIDPMVALRHE